MQHRPSTPNRRARQLPLLPDVLWPPPRAVLCGAGWCLAVTGETRLAAWQPLVVEAVRLRYSNEQTCGLMVGNVVRLFKFLAAHGARGCGDVTAELVDKWCWAGRFDGRGRIHPVSQTTARHREWAAFVCFSELALVGCPIDPVALIGERIAASPPSVSARPLDAEEERLAKRRADTGMIGSRLSLQFALSLGGGSLREVASVRARDIDVDAATVTFRGGSPRTNSLDDWSAEMVLRWRRCLPEPPDPDELVCLSRRLAVADGARSVGTQLGNVLREAGIKHRPGVSAGSVRLTGARHVFEAHGIEAAARFLGAVSLDRTAVALGHRWRDGGDA